MELCQSWCHQPCLQWFLQFLSPLGALSEEPFTTYLDENLFLRRVGDRSWRKTLSGESLRFSLLDNSKSTTSESVLAGNLWRLNFCSQSKQKLLRKVRSRKNGCQSCTSEYFLIPETMNFQVPFLRCLCPICIVEACWYSCWGLEIKGCWKEQ